MAQAYDAPSTSDSDSASADGVSVPSDRWTASISVRTAAVRAVASMAASRPGVSITYS